MNLRNFFAELKRRNVYKVALAYGVVAWLLMQIATLHHSFEIASLRRPSPRTCGASLPIYAQHCRNTRTYRHS
jgi:hypothetical protein